MNRKVWAVAALLAACSQSSTDESGWQRRVGQIMPELSSLQMIQIPPEVRVGQAFDVIVRTVGSSSCTRAADLDVDVDGARLDLTPWDEFAPPETPCTDDLHGFEHRASVTLHTVGPVRVSVHGRTPAGAKTRYDMEIAVRP